METPFINDPMPMIFKAFRMLYPDAQVDEIYYEPGLKDEEGKEAFGYTNFADDGTVQIFVSADASIMNAAETLAHELAHCAVGEGNGHNEEWESAFSAIHEKYMSIMECELASYAEGCEDCGFCDK